MKKQLAEMLNQHRKHIEATHELYMALSKEALAEMRGQKGLTDKAAELNHESRLLLDIGFKLQAAEEALTRLNRTLQTAEFMLSKRLRETSASAIRQWKYAVKRATRDDG